MILLDTHIWAWLVNEDLEKLTKKQIEHIQTSNEKRLAVSVISVWEVAKKVELGKWDLSLSVDDWVNKALDWPGVTLIDFTPTIALESTRLPGDFHRDPMDQIIVATARVKNIPLVTSDSRILNYPYVETIK